VGSVAFASGEKGPRDQRYSHDELHDEVEIAPKVAPVPRKPLTGKIDNTANHAPPTDSRFSVAGKLFRPNIVFIYAYLT
jgi:hypothetical protein